MLPKTDFRALLQQNQSLIIDGALATELEARGHDLNNALWSARLLQRDPGSIQQVHLDYYLAGADIAITASYQASTIGLSEHLGLDGREAAELVKRSVKIAQDARSDAFNQLSSAATSTPTDTERKLLVAGSVGPYGAYLSDGSEYRGDYQRTMDEFKDFHRPRIGALVDANVDFLAIETIPSMPEIEALCSLLQSEFPDAVAWISCTLRDAEHLSDGTSMSDVFGLVSKYEQVLGFGVNCVPVQLVAPWLLHMQRIAGECITKYKMPVLLCYPNSGEVYDAESKAWSGPKPVEHVMGNQAAKWIAGGAKLVGGCCRTGPKDIAGIAAKLQQQ
ncbi:homocysteine S-methyltransferase [Hortaea werneckii]|nr:homocysteine S-methyltransferase [Hortaea werneckii]